VRFLRRHDGRLHTATADRVANSGTRGQIGVHLVAQRRSALTAGRSGRPTPMSNARY
jgi:hypothetical protein